MANPTCSVTYTVVVTIASTGLQSDYDALKFWISTNAAGAGWTLSTFSSAQKRCTVTYARTYLLHAAELLP